MTARARLSWPGQRRGAIRVTLLFLITAGAYWPIWVTRAYGWLVTSIVIAIAIVAVSAVALASGGGDSGKQGPTRPRVQYSDIAADPNALWVTRIDNSTLQRLDPGTERPIGAPIRIRRTPLD